ncbi:hypothetical protein GIB67_021398 [Kingdonia uniflora]|uniref:Uncharacterized protein n=1 Tax=Kingdonia uniflora TaxID=39325 RepID=A0A7J7MDB3_9MAGN|nr:hypothetical protein GIB67_021398 [Kingdonia uniflora]
MTPSCWVDLMRKSKKISPFIFSDSRAFLDHNMFAIMSGPTIAAISVVFDHAEQEDVFQTCVDGFLAIAKISACHHLEDVPDDLVVSLCKFTTLVNLSSIEEPVLAFGDDSKARMTTITVFTIANTYGDYIRSGWRNILDCILRLHKLGLLPTCVANDVADDSDISVELGPEKLSTLMPCAFVEKAVFGLLRIYQHLPPYKENLADEVLRSLHFVLKLNDRVTHTYCEHITQEVTRLVKANAIHIRSQMGWHTIINLLSITAHYPDASETGFDALIFIMSQGVYLSPVNYILCVDALRQFAESRHGQAEQSLHALDLMAGSISCLSRWSHETKGEEAAEKVSQDIGEMWLRLVQELRKVCLDMREEGKFQYGNCSREADDLRAIVLHFSGAKHVICAILGHSKGGNMVLLYASRHYDVPKVVNVYGCFDLEKGIGERLGKESYIDLGNRLSQYKAENDAKLDSLRDMVTSLRSFQRAATSTVNVDRSRAHKGKLWLMLRGSRFGVVVVVGLGTGDGAVLVTGDIRKASQACGRYSFVGGAACVVKDNGAPPPISSL